MKFSNDIEDICKQFITPLNKEDIDKGNPYFSSIKLNENLPLISIFEIGSQLKGGPTIEYIYPEIPIKDIEYNELQNKICLTSIPDKLDNQKVRNY